MKTTGPVFDYCPHCARPVFTGCVTTRAIIDPDKPYTLTSDCEYRRTHTLCGAELEVMTETKGDTT